MESNQKKQFVVERRKYRRFKIPLDIKFKTSKESSDYHRGMIRNFSRFGFCFESENMPLKINDTVECVVRLPMKESFIPASGDIVWTRKEKDKFLTGIKLGDIDTAAKREILDYGYDSWLDEVRRKRSAALI